jgi:hypothetical protein
MTALLMALITLEWPAMSERSESNGGGGNRIRRLCARNAGKTRLTPRDAFRDAFQGLLPRKTKRQVNPNFGYRRGYANLPPSAAAGAAVGGETPAGRAKHRVAGQGRPRRFTSCHSVRSRNARYDSAVRQASLTASAGCRLPSASRPQTFDSPTRLSQPSRRRPCRTELRTKAPLTQFLTLQFSWASDPKLGKSGVVSYNGATPCFCPTWEAVLLPNLGI